MKKIIALFAAFTVAIAAFAQTPEEIVNKMSEVMDKLGDNGTRMTTDSKIPLLGTMSTTIYSLGNKVRLEFEMKGTKAITWMDRDTEWAYDPVDNTVIIKNRGSQKKPKELNNPNMEDLEMFEDITDGYDVVLKKETNTAWYLQCKKSKSNKDKDAPKTMDLVVAKKTYYPISLSTKMMGFTLTMRNLGFNVTEKDVTFNKADYPGVTIIDERK